MSLFGKWHPPQLHELSHEASRGMRHFVRARIHRRIFVGMGIAIFLTLGALVGMLYLFSPEDHPAGELREIEAFFSSEFGEAWQDEARLARLVERASRAFRVRLTLEDARGQKLARFDQGCDKPDYWLPVVHGGENLGRVAICSAHSFRNRRAPVLAAFLASGCVLWLLSGLVAHKASRPLGDLVDVTRELGEGKLSSRARLGRHLPGEVGLLAVSINDMASRIERQISDQKELLAGVSHEIRTPLARLRVLTELLRGTGADDARLDDIEREIAEIDDLTDRLLASSRLDFEAGDRKDLSAHEVALSVIERHDLSPTLLEVEGDPHVEGDLTLLGRALGNLIQNARAHGGGVSRVTVEAQGDEVVFAVEDDGPGFPSDDRERVFESFYRGRNSARSQGSLGLGLSLVRRIARAHGGDAFAENRPGGGAKVGFSVRVRKARAT